MRPDDGAEDLKRLMANAQPRERRGRLTLIARFGAGKVAEHLPRLIRTVREEGANVVWVCDPMHGNTIKSASGYKTRPFDSVLREVREFFAVHKAEGTIPGGVHFEMTGQDVTECTGGVRASAKRICRTATTPPATRASTPRNRWNWPSSWPRN